MSTNEVLRIVDAIVHDKHVNRDLVFQAIEKALVAAADQHFGNDHSIVVNVDRQTGAVSGTLDGSPLDPEATAGCIRSQAAKQVIIRKVREAETN